MDRAERLIEKMLALRVPKERIRGCTPAEIDAIQHRYRVQLPKSYKHFLATLGNSEGIGHHDFHLFARSLADIMEAAADMAEDKEETLPPGAFPFSARLIGDELIYFIIQPHDEDPPIFRWTIGIDNPAQCGSSIWDEVEAQLESWMTGLPTKIKGPRFV